MPSPMSFPQIEPASARHGSDSISILLPTLPFRAAVKKGEFSLPLIVTVGADHLKEHVLRQHGHLWWIGAACCDVCFAAVTEGVPWLPGFSLFIPRDFAALLRSEGYSVWTDADLISSDRREVIDGKLNAADAVIVIWASDSVASDWATSEAEHARPGQLIPPRGPHGADPKPFDSIHTGFADDRPAILAAAVRHARAVHRHHQP